MCDEIDPKLLEKESILNYANKFIDVLALFNHKNKNEISELSKSFTINYFNEMILFGRRNDESKIFGKIKFINKSNQGFSYKDLFLRSIVDDVIEYEMPEFLGIGLKDVMQLEFGDYGIIKEKLRENKEHIKKIANSLSNKTPDEFSKLEDKVKKEASRS